MKYRITVMEMFVCDVVIEADSIEEAEEKGKAYYFDGDFAEDHMGIPTYAEMKIESENESIEGIEL